MNSRYNIHMIFVTTILLPLSITLAIEPIIFSLIRKFNFKIFVVATISNLVLNTLMNAIYTSITNYSFAESFLSFFEFLTLFIEPLIICLVCKEKYGKSLLFSLIANLSSLIVGGTINSMLLSPVIVCILFFSAFIIFFILVFFYNADGQENNCNNESRNHRNNKAKE